jgi:hypothetical protein
MTRSRADEVLESWDHLSQSLPRPTAFRRPTRPPMVALALAVVGVLVVAVLGVAVLWSLPNNQVAVPPTRSPGATPSRLASPSRTPTATPVSTPTPVPTGSSSSGVEPVTVVARIAIPFPDSQTAPQQALAVVYGSIWIATPGHLVRIDPIANQVIATIRVEQSYLIAGDGALWTLSPVEMVPGPSRLTVSGVLSRNEIIATDFPEIHAAGLGSLWAISQDTGLVQIDPSTGKETKAWAEIKGRDVEVGCGGLWIRSFMDTLTWFDPTTGASGTPIDVSIGGAGRVHETASGCYVVLGNPGDTGTGVENGYVARIDETGIVNKSPAISERVHIAGDTVWTSTLAGVIQQIDPLTAAPIGNAWQLPTDELATNPKFADWRLISAGSNLYLLTPASVTRVGLFTSACLGGVAQATCDEAISVALAAVASSGWTPAHIWVNSGFFCPSQDCLFDPAQNFPYPLPPDGGQWVANVEIAFAGTDQHAGLHIAQVGSKLVPVLIGYRVPLPGWCSGTCP